MRARTSAAPIFCQPPLPRAARGRFHLRRRGRETRQQGDCLAGVGNAGGAGKTGPMAEKRRSALPTLGGRVVTYSTLSLLAANRLPPSTASAVTTDARAERPPAIANSQRKRTPFRQALTELTRTSYQMVREV